MTSRHTIVILVFVWAATTGAPCHTADWPQFRGVDNASLSVEADLPVQWSRDGAAWSVEFPGRCVSGPIVTGKRVFTTSSSGRNNERLHVFCVDSETGQISWRRRLWATGRTLCHPLTSMAAPTPATDGVRVYVLFSSNDLVCFDLEGNVLWARAIGAEHPQAFDDRGLGSSPLLLGDTLVLQVECCGDSFAQGIDCRDGGVRWQLALPHSINWLSPATLSLDGQQLALLQTTDKLLIVVPTTGEIRASYETPGASIASPVASDGMIFLPSRGLTALQFDAEQRLLELAWQENRLGAQNGSPVVDRNRLYVIRSSNVLVCLRLRGSQFWATPVVAGDYLYAVNAEGSVQVVHVGGDEPEIVARNDMAEEMLGSPAFADGAIYLRGVSHLWKIGR
jgi:outer membrane protein assembly factor BamB